MFGFDEPLGHLTSSGTFANLEALWIAQVAAPGQGDPLGRERALHARAPVRGAERTATRPCRRTSAGGWTWTRSSARLAAGGVGTVVVTAGHDVARGARRRRRGRGSVRGARRARCTSTRRTAASSRCSPTASSPPSTAGPFAAIARRRLGRRRPAQARPSAVRLRLRALRAIPASRGSTRTTRRTRTSPRDELHPGEIDARVLPRRRGRGGALGDAARAAADAGGARLPSRRGPRGRAGARRTRVRGDLELVSSRSSTSSASSPATPSAVGDHGVDRARLRIAGRLGWHVAKLRLDTEWLRRSHPWVEADAPTATVLRLCLIKPEHLGIIDDVADRLIVANTPAELR